MNKFSKILITCLVTILIVVSSIYLANKNIFGNNYSRKIEISQSGKDKIYNSTEKIVLSGVASPESEIILSWNGQFGLIESDKNGKWAVNLGTMPEGKYSLQMIVKDSENTQSIATAQITVDNSVKNQTQTVSFVNNVLNFLTAALSFSGEKIPEQLITIPQSTPSVLQGNWELVK